jgi:hypothetical protein
VDQTGKILNEDTARFSHDTTAGEEARTVQHAAGLAGAGGLGAGLSRLLHEIDPHVDLGPIGEG